MDLRSGINQAKYNRLVSSPESGITVVEPIVYPALKSSYKMVYTQYNEVAGSYRATLSPKQVNELTRLVTNELGLVAPVMYVSIVSHKNYFWLSFTIIPETLCTKSVNVASIQGLKANFISAHSLIFNWDLRESRVKWPSWLKPHQ